VAIIKSPDQTEDFSVLPDPNYIFVFDDLLPKWLVTWGDEMMQNFNWKYGQSAYPGGQRFFGQVLKDENIIREDPWPMIVNLIPRAFRASKIQELLGSNAQLIDIKKILVNGQLPSTPGNPHKDNSSSNAWTLVYHCSNTDGGNSFYKDDFGKEIIKEVDFLPGRCVLFPSWYTHVGHAPTFGWRISIAYHMLIQSDLNQKRFLTSMNLS
jgi:hypothetical protein